MNTSTNLPTSNVSVSRNLTVVSSVPAAPSLIARPVPRAPAANANTARDAEILARRRAVEELYTGSRAALVRAAQRLVGSPDEASDVVQEAFAVLLESPTRKLTRAAAWCIVRDLARERRAEAAMTDAYVEDNDAVMNEAGAWLERVLGG
jgi:hypothetical protein